MKQQKDWYTGIDYYVDYKEKQIQAQQFLIEKETKQDLHEEVEIYLVLDGSATINVNGLSYPFQKGSFLCLYMHHFYQIHSIKSSLRVIRLSFYIGNFMYMCFEKHPKNANAVLVYDTCPIIQLSPKEYDKIEHLMLDILEEQKEKRFSSINIISYLTMQVHALHCRYAFERVKEMKQEHPWIWKLIPEIILSTSKNLTLDEIAQEYNMTSTHVNLLLKQTCGYTFFQLQKFGKIINACALLHFPELSLNYISDLLNFSTVQDFCRVFEHYVHKSPKTYQKQCIMSEQETLVGCGSALLFLQYLHLNFMKQISITTLAQYFHMKEYTVKAIFHELYECSFHDLLEQIRIQYACAYLLQTDFSITEVSSRCGFDNVSTFSRAFQRQCGTTPSFYKKHE